MFSVRRVLLEPRLSSPPIRLPPPRVGTTRRAFKSLSPQPTPRLWSGLQSWREAPTNECRTWGPDGPCQPTDPAFLDDDPTACAASLAKCAALVLSTPDPLAKSRLSHLAYSRWRRHGLPVGVARPPDRPARPDRPILVSPKEIPAHKSLGLPLNSYMLHNLAHVELNAIDLAWDTVARFSPFHEALGDEFFSDFARVADDESRHFAWCSQRLAELGFSEEKAIEVAEMNSTETSSPHARYNHFMTFFKHLACHDLKHAPPGRNLERIMFKTAQGIWICIHFVVVAHAFVGWLGDLAMCMVKNFVLKA